MRDEKRAIQHTIYASQPSGPKPTAKGVCLASLILWLQFGLLVTADHALAQDITQDKVPYISGDEFKLALDDETAEHVDAWIVQLSSPDYARRQAARTSLGSVGAPSFAKLRVAYQATDELEVRLLIEDMVHDAYIRWHARANKTGFLGISSDRRVLTNADDKRVTPGSVGLVISTVMPSTPAQRAGLLVSDVIIALENHTISAKNTQPFSIFASEIQRLGPGRRVQLTILRGADQLKISPILGIPNSAQVKNLVNLRERVDMAMKRFPIWWATQFRQEKKHQGAM